MNASRERLNGLHRSVSMVGNAWEEIEPIYRKSESMRALACFKANCLSVPYLHRPLMLYHLLGLVAAMVFDLIPNFWMASVGLFVTMFLTAFLSDLSLELRYDLVKATVSEDAFPETLSAIDLLYKRMWNHNTDLFIGFSAYRLVEYLLLTNLPAGSFQPIEWVICSAWLLAGFCVIASIFDHRRHKQWTVEVDALTNSFKEKTK